MAPSKNWEEEDSDSSESSSAPVIARRGKFEDEEDDSDVVDDWDAAEDSEVEREKAKRAAEAKAKAEEAAKANHKTKTQRVEEHKRANQLRKQQDEESSDEDDDETEAEKRSRLRASEKESDMKHAEDLFGDIGISDKRGGAKPVTIQEGDDPANAIDLSSLKLFHPTTAAQFHKLRDTLTPLLIANSKKPQYALFLQEFSKQLVRDMNSEQIKKISSGLSTISNEKMKEEKAAEKGGKKTKAAKTKVTLSANRDVSSKADTTAYEDGLDDGDFM